MLYFRIRIFRIFYFCMEKKFANEKSFSTMKKGKALFKNVFSASTIFYAALRAVGLIE